MEKIWNIFSKKNWKDISEELGVNLQIEWLEKGFTYNKTKEWIEVGLKVTDAGFAEWLRDKLRINAEQFSSYDYQDLKEQYIFFVSSKNKLRDRCINAQSLLDFAYPKSLRWSVEELDLSNLNLKGNLDISDFLSLREIDTFGNPQLGEIIDKKERKTPIKFNAQEWLDQNYPNRQEVKEINSLDNLLQGELVIGNFPNLKKIYVSGNSLTCLQVVNCPQLVDLKCAINKRPLVLFIYNCPQLRKLSTWNSRLTKISLDEFLNLKELDVTKNCLVEVNTGIYPHLQKLSCSGNFLTSLDLDLNTELEELCIENNSLTNLKLTNNPQLKKLDISNNNFSNQDLSFLKHLINLKELKLGNNNKKRIDEGIHNRFVGSLEHLKNLTKLEHLNIDNTDLNSGVEYLPDNLGGVAKKYSWSKEEKKVYYSTNERPESKVKEIKWQLDLLTNEGNLKKWEELGFTFEEVKSWIKSGLEVSDANYAKWLKDIKKASAEWVSQNSKESKELKERYQKYGLCEDCQQPNVGKNWCGNCSSVSDSEINKFIQKCQQESRSLGWIPYEQFTNIEYLAEGGFGKVYKAKWTREKESHENDYAVLKVLNNSRNMTADLLQEINYYKLATDKMMLKGIVDSYGISQDPATQNYVMVMNYMNGGTLREFLGRYELSYYEKINELYIIALGLHYIHSQGLVHCDFHPGNILVNKNDGVNTFLIADLGLCRPVEVGNKEKAYGVLPYVAPEVLQDRQYTADSDIYSFGMIIYEIFVGVPPYHDLRSKGLIDDAELALKICQGLRPQFTIKIPQLLENMIKRCWDADPEKRPSALELHKFFWNLSIEIAIGDWDAEHSYRPTHSDLAAAILSNSANGEPSKEHLGRLAHILIERIEGRNYPEFYQQYLEAEKFNRNFFKTSSSYQIHSQVIYTSRLLDFSHLPSPQNNLSQEWQTTALLDLKIKGINKELQDIKNHFQGELVELVENFIQAKKKMLEDNENKEAREISWELEDRLEEKLSEEEVKQIIRHCERLVNLEKQKEKKQLETKVEIPAKK